MIDNLIEIKNSLIVFSLALVLTYFSQKIAPFLSLIDHPNGNLKNHIQPTPSTGGLAIFFSIIAALLLNIQLRIINENIMIILFLLGVFLLGLLDDKKNLGVSIRLAVQFGLVILLLSYIEPPIISGLFLLDFLISTLFCVACINAMNILDIMDGLAAGVAFFALLNCFILLGNGLVFYNAIVFYTLLSLVAFLAFNFAPAKIFMGDAGSTFLGGLIAIVVLGVFGQAATLQEKISYIFPVSAILFELLFVIIIRLKKGLNPTKGSPDHLALRMRKLGFSVKNTVLIIYLFSAICIIFSLLIKYSEFPFLIMGIFIVYLLVIGFKMSKVIVD